MNQIKAGAFLGYLTIGLNNIIGLLYTPFMLRMMGQSEYGLYSLAASVIAYLTIFDFGFGNAIVRYTAKLRAEGNQEKQFEMFGVFWLLYLLIGFVAFLIGVVICYNTDYLFNASMSIDEIKKMRIILLLMICNLAFTFPMSIFGSIITAYENFVFQKVINLIRIVLNTLLMIVLLLMGYKAIGMVVVITLFNVLTLSTNAWFCFYRLHIKLRFKMSKIDWSFLKEISVYSFWIFLNAIIDRIYWDSGQFILGVFAGAAVIAVYAVAIQLVNMYKSFSTTLSGLYLPKITAMITNGESNDKISDLFIRTGRIQYIILAFILSGFVVFGNIFVKLWAGPDYVNSYYIALILFVPFTVPLIQNVGITILQAKNKMKFRSVLYLIISLLSLGISIPLGKLYGGIGCAIGTSSALLIGQIIIMNIYYQRELKLNIVKFWREIGKMSIVPTLLCVTGVAVLYYFQIRNLWFLGFAVIIYAIVYLPLFWYKAMNQYERDLFLKPMKQFLKK